MTKFGDFSTMKRMKTMEAPIKEDTSEIKLGVKHEKELRSFVVSCFDAWQKGEQKPIAGDKALAIVRKKLQGK